MNDSGLSNILRLANYIASLRSAYKFRLPLKLSSRGQNGNILPKLLFSLIVLLVLIVIIAIFASRNPSLKVNDHSYKLIVASSSAQKTKGLGYRRSLPQNQGMLFVFNASARYCFWMKAMRFRLDIIWLNASKRVVYLKPNLSPATYPKNYCPLQPARYVIELNAGQAAKSDVRLGQTLKF